MRLKEGTVVLFLLVLANAGRALPGLLEGSGDYDDTEVVETARNPYAASKPIDDEILDPIDSDGGIYPEDDDDYNVTDDGSESVQSNETASTKTSLASLDTGPLRFNLMESFSSDNDTFEPVLTAVKKEPEVQSCSGHKIQRSFKSEPRTSFSVSWNMTLGRALGGLVNVRVGNGRSNLNAVLVVARVFLF